jgi:hypothetical protein
MGDNKNEESQKNKDVKELKDLFANDPDIIADKVAEENDNTSLRDIINSNYVWQDGAGWVPKSMMTPKTHINIRSDDDKTVV